MLETMLESTFSSARRWRTTLALGLVAALAASPVAHAVGGGDADEAVVDRFHPDKGDGKAPLYGGRAIVHVPSLPENMCYPIENSAVTRRFLYETHETLLLQDWWSHDYVPDAAASWVEEDLVVLNPDAPAVEGEIAAQVVRRGEGETGLREVRAVYGSITDAGANWTISPMSKGSSIAGPVQVPKGAVERVERGSR